LPLVDAGQCEVQVSRQIVGGLQVASRRLTVPVTRVEARRDGVTWLVGRVEAAGAVAVLEVASRRLTVPATRVEARMPIARLEMASRRLTILVPRVKARMPIAGA
jgi:hypothetical protein